MAYYLSPKDRATVVMILRLVKSGETKIVGDPTRIVYLIRQASNLDFPELKDWIYKRKENYVQVTKRIPVDLDALGIVVDDRIDFLGIISHLTQTKPNIVIYKDTSVSDSEFKNLLSYCNANRYEVNRDLNTTEIKCTKLD